MDKSNHHQEQTLRKADLKVGLVISAVLIFFLMLTLKFPMSGSYGGVENQWYVSPALLPLFLLTLLLLCTGYLIFNALRTLGVKESIASFFQLSGWVGELADERNRSAWFVIFMLLAYVYVYIPRTDFYFATVTFMLSLMCRFYLANLSIYGYVTGLNVLACLGLIGIGRYAGSEFEWLPSNPIAEANQVMVSDIFLIVILVVMVCIAILYKALNFKKGLALFYSAILTPLILVLAFNFLLYVPMPVENGLMMQLITYIAYDVIGL